MLSKPTACKAPTCHADVASKDKYFGILAGRLDKGMYTEDCSARDWRDRDELTICCRRFSYIVLDGVMILNSKDNLREALSCLRLGLLVPMSRC